MANYQSYLMILFYLSAAFSTSSATDKTELSSGLLTRSEMRSLDIRPAGGTIIIDAELDDEGWENATRISGFIERTPREGAEPPVRTEVLVTYDEMNLYVAFIASDPNPADIRAALQPRDQLWRDDWVGVLLDPYGDASLGYYFLSNPIGVQGDLQMTTRSEDDSIDFVYETAGRITDEGFIVEMAIPFRSLRISSQDVQNWGIMFVRTYPRSSRHYLTWPSWSRNNPCQLCEMAQLNGIENIRTGGNLEMLPSLVASQAGRLRNPSDPGSFENGRVQVQPSLGLKYTFRPGWTAEATVNPDFSQVESDAAQIDVNTTFALFFPERRPFFQEGMDLYRTPMSVFYSRSINAPAVSAKITGRTDRTSIGYIGARDDHSPFIIPLEEQTVVLQGGKSYTNVLRLQHNLQGSHVGAMVTDRRLDSGGSGTTASVDGIYRFGEMYNLSAQLVISHTSEPDDPELSTRIPDRYFGTDGRNYSAAFDGESYSGHAGFFRFAQEARTWSWNVLYMEVSPTYRADTGFQSQNNFRRATGLTYLTFYPNKPFLERFSASIFGGSYWNFDGVRNQDIFQPGISFSLPRQISIGMEMELRREIFRGTELTGIRNFYLSVNTNFSAAFQGGLDFSTGRRIARTLAVPEVGYGKTASFFAYITPVQRFVIQPSLSYQELSLDSGEEIFSGYIARTRFSYQFTRELNLRAIFQYNDFSKRLDIEPLLVYQLNPFSIFYIGSTYGSVNFDEYGFTRTDRQYFAKFQYLIRY